jgi:hypothetical protein
MAWTDQEYAEWLSQAGEAYGAAMRSELAPHLFADLGSVFALAAQDRRKFSFWMSDERKEEVILSSWREHKAAIERLRAGGKGVQEAVERYLSDKTGTGPLSVERLRELNRRTGTLDPAGRSARAWEFELILEKDRRLAKMNQELPGSTATAGAIAYHASTKDKDWQHALEFGRTLESLTAPLREFLSGYGLALAGRPLMLETPQRAVATQPHAPEKRPELDVRSTRERLTELETRQAREGRVKDPERALHDPTGQEAPEKAGKAPPPPAAVGVEPEKPDLAHAAGVPKAPVTVKGAAKVPAAKPPPKLSAESEATLREVLRDDTGAVEAVIAFFDRFQQKLARDPVTVRKIAGLFRDTRGILARSGRTRTYLASRSAAAELRVLVRLLTHPSVTRVRGLTADTTKGSVTADFEAVINGKAMPVEVTGTTGARSGVYTPSRTPGLEEGGKPANADRPPRNADILNAVRRKLASGQADGGIIVINLPFTKPSMIDAATRASIRQMMQRHRAANGRVVEIWAVMPDTAEPQIWFLAGQGLGLATPLPTKP